MTDQYSKPTCSSSQLESYQYQLMRVGDNLDDVKKDLALIQSFFDEREDPKFFPVSLKNALTLIDVTMGLLLTQYEQLKIVTEARK